MSRSSEVVRFFYVGLLLLLPLSAAAETTYVKPEFGNAYTFTPLDEQTVAVSVPVTLEPNVDAKTLDAKVVDVAVGALHDPNLRACIGAKFEPPTAATTSAITIKATCTTFRPLVYTVTVSITPPRAPKAAKAPEPQKLALQLTAPTAELRAIPAQTVIRTCKVLPFSVCGKEIPPLIVTETSGTTRLTEVTVKQADQMLDSDGSPAGGHISSTTTAVEAGMPGSIPLVLTGHFPMGTVKTNVAITARELATPVIVPFEIRTRLHEWLIFPTILVGLGLGFLLRVSLKRWIERGTAKIAALDLLQKFDAARVEQPDADFQKDVDVATRDLKQAMTNADAAQVTAGVTAGNDALKKALEDLSARLALVATAVDEIAPHIESAAQFPEPIGPLLSDAAPELEAVRKLAKDRNAAAAAPRIAALRTKLTAEVHSAAVKWRDAIRLNVDRAGTMPPMPASLATPWTEAFTALAAQLTAIPVGKPNPDLASILEKTYNAAFSAEHDIKQRLLPPLADYAKRIANLFPIAEKAKIVAAVDALVAAIDADTSTTLDGLVQSAAALLDEMKHAIVATAVQQNVPVQTRQKIDAAIASGNYEEAVGYAIGTLLGGAGVVTDAVTMSGRVAISSRFGPRSATVLTVGGHDPIQVAREQTWREIAVAKFASSFGFAFLLALAGMIALAPTFDGTWRGLVTALFWGYASDISADALAEAAKKT